MQTAYPEPGLITRLLAPYLSKRRKKRIEEILAKRTCYLTVVLHDLYHEHNMSAVVRSCEAFGLQECHAIEVENRFKPAHGVAIGAQQWIDIVRHDSVAKCLNRLRHANYRLFAADPPDKAENTNSKRAFDIKEIDVEKGPIAIVLGKELDGLTDEIRNLCDATVYVPMAGFTESLNVSVTAAICIHELRNKLDKMPPDKWCLDEKTKEMLRAKWYLNSLKNGNKILKELLSRTEHPFQKDN